MARKMNLPEEIRKQFVEFGRQGGRIGGPARIKRLDQQERQALARKASKARWAKVKKTTPK
ncbi:MAG TPA: hypothetical protein VKV57_01405 [bacterium]|nr:hypothetical protein [bacterium]